MVFLPLKVEHVLLTSKFWRDKTISDFLSLNCEHLVTETPYSTRRSEYKQSLEFQSFPKSVGKNAKRMHDNRSQ